MARVICLQPVAIVDHVAHVNEDQLTAILGDEEQHGSRRVDATTAQKLLGQIGMFGHVPLSDRDCLYSVAGMPRRVEHRSLCIVCYVEATMSKLCRSCHVEAAMSKQYSIDCGISCSIAGLAARMRTCATTRIVQLPYTPSR